MPLALEPNETFRVVLESDKKKLPDKQPYFEFRFLSSRAWKTLTQKRAEIRKSASGDEAFDKLFEILSVGLVGWGNMIDPDTRQPIKFNKKDLDRLLTISELGELLVKFQNQGLEVDDLKNLG